MFTYSCIKYTDTCIPPNQCMYFKTQDHPIKHFLTWFPCCSDATGTGVVNEADTETVVGTVMAAVTNVDGDKGITVDAAIVTAGSDEAAECATAAVLRWINSCEQNFNAASNNCPGSVWNNTDYKCLLVLPFWHLN